MSNKVPCGGFYLDDSLIINDENKLGLAPGAGGGLPTGGAPYQQLVTDGTSKATWEDRLAYDNKTVFVEKTEITNAGQQASVDPSLLVDGTQVTVVIDGEEYNTTLDEGGTYILGTGSSNCYYHIGVSGSINISSKTTNTSGYPFFVVIYEDGICMVLFDGESVGTKHTFGVYAGEIKQIDSKYIPPTTVIVNVTTNDDGTFSADKTFDEVKALIDSGIDVKCRYNGVEAKYIGYIEAEGIILFECVTFASQGVFSFIFTSDGIDGHMIPLSKLLLPSVSNSDNNKFLRVVNGVWTASSDLIIPSTTSGSSKKFKITVDDSGTITATEVTT